jgi:hypothetical protein
MNEGTKMETEKTIFEINGVKLEVDLRTERGASRKFASDRQSGCSTNQVTAATKFILAS